MRVRLDTNRACPGYIAALLNSSAGRQQIGLKLKQIVGQATINRSDLESLEIALSSLAVQDRLAEELRIHEAGAARVQEVVEAQLAAVNDLPGALLRQAFSGDL